MEFVTGVRKTDTSGIRELTKEGMEGACVRVEGAVHAIRNMGEVSLWCLEEETDFFSVCMRRERRILISES